MGYRRVLPRDLFNEASLLKCIGRLWLLTEGNDRARFLESDVPFFEIIQSDDDGSIEVVNLTFEVGGRQIRLSRPLNSRRPWPLYLSEKYHPAGFDPVEVFTDDGSFTVEMEAFVKGRTT